MYQYLFGPVPSRRLGISLGIDLVPMKTCSLNCIYCECGRTKSLSLARKEYVPPTQVKSEFQNYLSNHPKPEYITFSGAGEPALNSFIVKAIHFIRSHETRPRGWPHRRVRLFSLRSLTGLIIALLYFQ